MTTRRTFCLAALSTLATFISLAALPPAARADDKKPDDKDEKKLDATGTWKWETKARDGTTRENTIKLKQDGDKLTGAVVARNGKETEIKEGTVSGAEISFKVTRTGQNGQETTTSYSGKVEGDTLKGKIETNGRSRDWEAKRSTDAKESSDPKESKDSKDAKDVKDAKDAKDAK